MSQLTLHTIKIVGFLAHMGYKKEGGFHGRVMQISGIRNFFEPNFERISHKRAELFIGEMFRRGERYSGQLHYIISAFEFGAVNFFAIGIVEYLLNTVNKFVSRFNRRVVKVRQFVIDKRYHYCRLLIFAFQA
jgi:hypothetical protein